MFATLFRALSSFVMVVGFIAGATAVFALFFGNDTVRFAILFPLGVMIVAAGVKMRDRGSEQRIVGALPEEIANDFSVAKAIGLGAHAEAGKSALAGALAGLFVLIGINLAGLVTARAFLPALAVYTVFGALSALIKRQGMKMGRFHIENGRRYGPQRKVNRIVVPLITIVWLVLSAPEADPVILGLFALLTLWWIGAAFDYVWDVLHTTVLVLMYGEATQRTIEWGLFEWLRHTRADARVTGVRYVDGEVVVEGEFQKPDELRRELARLDFVRTVRLDPAGGR